MGNHVWQKTTTGETSFTSFLLPTVLARESTVVPMYACLLSLFSVISMLLKEKVHINLFIIIFWQLNTIQNYLYLWNHYFADFFQFISDILMHKTFFLEKGHSSNDIHVFKSIVKTELSQCTINDDSCLLFAEALLELRVCLNCARLIARRLCASKWRAGWNHEHSSGPILALWQYS